MLPPPDPGTPLDPVELGCMLDCRVALDLGSVTSPFGTDPARTARTSTRQLQRMGETEREIVGRGLPIASAASGAASRFEPARGLAVDAAVLAPDRRELQRGRGSPIPDMAARIGLGSVRGPREDGLSLGVSTWVDGEGLGNRALGFDAAIAPGRWELRLAADRQWVHDVARVFGDAAEAIAGRRVRGDSLGLSVRRELRPRWSLDGLAEARVFVSRHAVALTPWVRTSLALDHDPRGPVRWTVLEIADLATIGPTGDDLVRISTAVTVRSRR